MIQNLSLELKNGTLSTLDARFSKESSLAGDSSANNNCENRPPCPRLTSGASQASETVS